MAADTGSGHSALAEVRIGSRNSDLAMVQAVHVQGLVQGSFSGTTAPITSSKTVGDKKLGESLSSLAAKNPGLFTKELEVALAAAEVDIVVHSLKDVPTTLPEGLVLGAITQREDPSDCLVLAPKHAQLQPVDGPGGASRLHALPHGAVVGTSSVRRAALLAKLCPHITVEDVRGNLNTRLAKLDGDAPHAPKYDALVLATAGMQRLGWHSRISETLPEQWFGYGVSQGALGIELRVPGNAADTALLSMVKCLQHPATAVRCAAERGLLNALQGGCQVPLAVSTTMTPTAAAFTLTLTATVLSADGSTALEECCDTAVALPPAHTFSPTATMGAPVPTGLATLVGEDEEYMAVADALGRTVAAKLVAAGAAKFMPAIGGTRPNTYGSPEEAGVPGRD